MRYLIAVLLLACTVAHADTTRIGSKIITDGMTSVEVLDRAGQPLDKSDITNRFGAVVASKWSYKDGRRAIVITIQSGKVVDIEETLL